MCVAAGMDAEAIRRDGIITDIQCAPRKQIQMEDKKEEIIRWLVRNVDASLVPGDEGNTEALLYNLIHKVLEDGKIYSYHKEQDAEIEDYCVRYGKRSNEIEAEDAEMEQKGQETENNSF